VKDALTGCAVAEEHDAHLICPPNLRAEADARGNRDVGADDAVGSQHSLVDVGDVHRSALATVGACGLAQKLGHHLVDVDAFGDAVVVTAMGSQDKVVIAEMGRYACRDSLLTDGRVHAPKFACVGLAARLLLEPADGDHRAVHPQQCVFVHRRVRSHYLPSLSIWCRQVCVVAGRRLALTLARV